MDLDDAYSVGAYIENAQSYPEMWARKAAAFRAELGSRAKLDLPYGKSPRERFDLFIPEGPAAGLLVFVHGGYWKAFDKNSWSHLAAGAIGNNWAVAMPSYTLAPEARLSTITRQVAQAVSAAARHIDGPIIVTGNSAGGHLAARQLDVDVLPKAVADRLTHVMPISPLSDLRPLLRTSMNEDLRLDAAEAKAESPIFMQNRHTTEVTVWVGADERPAFLDQARWLAEAWGASLEIAAGKHHFDVVEPLADTNSAMLRILLQL